MYVYIYIYDLHPRDDLPVPIPGWIYIGSFVFHINSIHIFPIEILLALQVVALFDISEVHGHVLGM